MRQTIPYEFIIFDLDGTLIDSAQSILECFDAVLSRARLKPVMAFDKALVGPPLRQTLMNLTGLPVGDSLERLVVSFQNLYDTSGYKAAIVYPGVEELLSSIQTSKVPMAIATNKRRVPTLKILEYFGWGHYFRAIGTLDGAASECLDKATLIKNMVTDANADVRKVPYIGDKWEDGEAAAANHMLFFAAGWGYGSWDAGTMPPDWNLINSPLGFIE